MKSIHCRCFGLFLRLTLTTFFFFTLLPIVSGQDLASFEKRVTRHTLNNGWTFIIVERPVAPVFAFMTRVNVGSAQEGAGRTGLAHKFEHMAFKHVGMTGRGCTGLNQVH